MARRPVIGITMRLELPTRRFYLGRDYCEAVEAGGGIPMHIGLIPKAEYISQAVAVLDGILLPGSNTDVDPQFYGEEPHHRLGTVIPEKDETDRLVLKAAEEYGLPVLGICYGMQALNVYRGGSLIQDIESQSPGSIKHEQGSPQDRSSHSIKVDPESRLAKLPTIRGAQGRVRVNSSHHQALNELGSGLKATAWSPDGIIEAVEDRDPERFVLGVQWHPELTAVKDPFSGEIFEMFIRECRKRMNERS